MKSLPKVSAKPQLQDASYLIKNISSVHGIESIQFRDYELPETVRTSLKCSIKSLAWKTKFKQKMAAIRTSLNMILEALGVI
ncbi:hypothetical protein HID58_048163 [Brassica napus]|uniref:Uncharacterized protein n=1 Tax=Brassica napus TaxID=3708 RepID=A0ABQ8B1B1_BRANA|nr:hypothetical protein HID58_048163 [Brassica napus]